MEFDKLKRGKYEYALSWSYMTTTQYNRKRKSPMQSKQEQMLSMKNGCVKWVYILSNWRLRKNKMLMFIPSVPDYSPIHRFVPLAMLYPEEAIPPKRKTSISAERRLLGVRGNAQEQHGSVFDSKDAKDIAKMRRG